VLFPIRNYEGKIFEYPETGNETVQFAPQREYHDEYLYSWLIAATGFTAR